MQVPALISVPWAGSPPSTLACLLPVMETPTCIPIHLELHRPSLFTPTQTSAVLTVPSPINTNSSLGWLPNSGLDELMRWYHQSAKLSVFLAFPLAVKSEFRYTQVEANMYK